MSEHKLHVYHNSQDISYRSPFGAVPAGQEIMIRILVKSEQPSSEVVLRLWERSNEEKIIPMALINENPDNGNRVYETFVTPEHHQVLWYYFKIQYEGTFYYYSRPDNLYGGAGCLSKRPHHSYQITVYRADFNVPKWYRQGVMYQIFPDRFRKGEDMQTEAFIKNDILNKDIIFHDNWDDVPNYLPDPLTGKILNNDFFGGNIQGIIEKLDYLKDLGITIIYLNPIFKSYSNHRYDTGDYLSIDPMLGDSEAFRFLCNQAGKRGIAIILDGVFSHTGSDSIYFNKNGNYPGIGAWQSKDSPYYPWYRFQKHPDEYAGSKGIPVVVMEPLRGGKLANVSPDIQELWDKADDKRSPVEWAFRWLYNFPEVAVILSGVSTMEQLNDNLRIFQDAKPNCMSQTELDLVKQVKALYDSKTKIGCTACEYCLPCPSGVAIPRIFGIWNDASIFGINDEHYQQYKRLIAEEKDARQCTECGNCESLCPQHLEIIDKLKEADKALRV
jgi:hypothetical protein